MEQKQQKPKAMPEVKICGITTMKEADWLNAAGADYAGFVFYEKSKFRADTGKFKKSAILYGNSVL